MDTKMHGKLIDYIDLNPQWTMDGNPCRITSVDGFQLKLSATHHGDHDQFWVIESKGGKEIRRYRAGAVQRIQWSSENGGTDL